MQAARMMGVVPEEMTDEQRRIYDAIVSGPRGNAGGVFMTWLHSPGMADPAQKLGEFLRFNTSLPPRLSELAILVIARHWTSQFEWFVHAPIAAKAGVPEAAIAAIRQRAVPTFVNKDEQAVYDFCVSILEQHSTSDAVYAAAAEQLGDKAVVELIGVLGYYVFVAMSLRTFGEQLPAGAVPPLEP